MIVLPIGLILTSLLLSGIKCDCELIKPSESIQSIVCDCGDLNKTESRITCDIGEIIQGVTVKTRIELKNQGPAPVQIYMRGFHQHKLAELAAGEVVVKVLHELNTSSYKGHLVNITLLEFVSEEPYSINIKLHFQLVSGS